MRTIHKNIILILQVAYLTGLALMVGGCTGDNTSLRSSPAVIQEEGDPGVSMALTEAEKQQAIQLASQANENRQLLATSEKSFVTAVEVVRDKEGEASGSPDRLVRVQQYRYRGDLTVETLVNLTREKVIEVNSTEGLTTPLSQEEFEMAKNLVMSDSKVLQALGPDSKTVVLEPLMTGSASQEDPLFGHRVVRILFKIGRDYLSSPTIFVDLTEEKVIFEGGNK